MDSRVPSEALPGRGVPGRPSPEPRTCRRARQAGGGPCELSTAGARLKWAVVAPPVMGRECGLRFARFSEFSREARNIQILKSWQLIQIFDKYGVRRESKYVCELHLARVLFACALCCVR